MDLGLSGKTAIICASSKGLGRACAFALASEGVQVVINGRTKETLDATAKEIETTTGAVVISVVADVTTLEGRKRLLEACPNPDILVNNAGGPPPGNFRDWNRDDWIAALDANMLAPILLIKDVVDGMIDRKFGRIVNITSAAVKSPIAILGLSNGARTGLTGFVAGTSREVAVHGVTINNLLPGPFNTDRLNSNLETTAKAAGRSLEEEKIIRMASNPTGRFGNPSEFGAACAFLCSDKAGFITGQNLLMDGGAFPGTM